MTPTLSRASASGTTAVKLTFSTLMSTAPGTYPITITGTSGTLVRTAVFQLTIAQAVPDFTITSATTSTAVRYGRATTIAYKLTVTPKYGFTGTVSLSASGAPSTATGSWTPQTLTFTGTAVQYATHTLSIPVGTPPGTYYVALTGTASNGATHTATAKITVS